MRGTRNTVADGQKRLDLALDTLAAGPRRALVDSLARVPSGRWLPLPDAACPSSMAIDREKLSLALHHKHLPLLAEAGYVRWEPDPFRVKQGPQFEEVVSVLHVLKCSTDMLPEMMRRDCPEFRDPSTA